MASYPLPVRRIRDFVIGFLQIPPRGGHPCLDGWFRSLRSMGDFHPLNASHTEHTRPRAYPTGTTALAYDYRAYARSHSLFNPARPEAGCSLADLAINKKWTGRGPILPV